ncbi:MAG: hypothetical protein DHS20C15_14850 [Planctomycetota bacterium]|nr:MAG: hypothetical protein DHS20C15_14850 [Planctomycetota bacterium]
MGKVEPKVTLQVLWQSEDSIRVTPFKEGSALESTVKTSRTCPFHSGLVADRATEILSLLARANSGDDGLLDQLVAAGRAIYVDLLPAFLKEKLREARGKSLVLHLDRQLVGIPWELLHDGDDFLGRAHRIGRLVSTEGDGTPPLQRNMQPPLSALVVADPAGDLPGARAEAAEVEAILEEAPFCGGVTVLTGKVGLRSFRDELARHDILHFAGHADPDPLTGEAHLRLADGKLPVSLIEQWRGRVDVPGLVFLNACASADAAHQMSWSGGQQAGRGGSDRGTGGRASGLASALLQAGVRHVVGTLWAVRDEVARRFATRFYRALSAGDSIGTAMAAGRDDVAAAWGEESLLWADHLLYGDPTWRVETPGNLTFADLDVLDGLQDKYRAELVSTDGATRLLAAAMLLRLGDRGAIGALAKELPLLESWMANDAPRQQRRQAALVVQALASAAGLAPSEPPDDLPDMAAVRGFVERLRS